ncbi:reverse transcriptase [Caerostris darwini]|uniref:Reverse transcriptase n=1 Tax=Caerostris darwini TaxID=1538125 RepID=A0AAV4TQ42_9ARAC|nr:reverse transcriptase [Caerostris darwini]
MHMSCKNVKHLRRNKAISTSALHSALNFQAKHKVFLCKTFSWKGKSRAHSFLEMYCTHIKVKYSFHTTLAESFFKRHVQILKPYISRTCANSYVPGAVLLQAAGSNEYPIEHARRLLSQAERNYLSMERVSLFVWALKKFHRYLEGSEVTLAFDHQPLRWLPTLRPGEFKVRNH